MRRKKHRKKKLVFVAILLSLSISLLSIVVVKQAVKGFLSQPIDFEMHVALNRDTVKYWCKGRFVVFEEDDEKGHSIFQLCYLDSELPVKLILEYCLQYKEIGQSVYIAADDGYCIIDKKQVSYRTYRSLEEMSENERSVFMEDSGFKGFAFNIINVIKSFFE